MTRLAMLVLAALLALSTGAKHDFLRASGAAARQGRLFVAASATPAKLGSTAMAGSKAPLNLLHAGPWNKTHITMTVSSGFDCPYNSDADYDADDDHPEVNIRCAELEMLVNDVKEAEKKLFQNLQDQSDIAMKLGDITETAAANARIRAHAQAVAKDTESASLGFFLAGMWREMRMFAKPFYSEHLGGKQKELQEEEKQLQTELDKAKSAVTVLKAQYAAEDKAEREYHEDGEAAIDSKIAKVDSKEAEAVELGDD